MPDTHSPPTVPTAGATPSPPTPCECPSPGWCARHKTEKIGRLYELCRTDRRYFDVWEQGLHLEAEKFRREQLEAVARGEILPPNAHSPHDSPCVHLGPISRHETCKSCGNRGVIAHVRYCRLRGECTKHAHGLAGAGGRLAVCAICPDFAPAPTGEPLVIEDETCLGDITVLAAAVRELAEQNPGRFQIVVRSHHPYLFEGAAFARGIGWNDPLPAEWGRETPRIVKAHCDPEHWTNRPDHAASINTSNQRPRHFVDAYCDHLSTALGLAERLSCRDWTRPAIILTNEERGWIPQVFEDSLAMEFPPFWLVNAGWKSDYPAKRWDGFAEVVAQTKHLVRWVQVGAAGDSHPTIPGVWRDLRGQTPGRKLVRLVHWSAGVLCGVTGLGHLAHWVDRPAGAPPRSAVIVGGGRESPHWFGYPGQQIWHTIGRLGCCATGGCWKSRVVPRGGAATGGAVPGGGDAVPAVPLGPDDCSNPSFDGREIGECMRLVDPGDVARQILALETHRLASGSRR